MAKKKSREEIVAKRERNSRIARRVGSFFGGPIEREIERRLLTKSWVAFRPEKLQGYLVASYQNPVINVQSILVRHELIREIDGASHDELMDEEMRWAVETQRALRKRQRELPAEHGWTGRRSSVQAFGRLHTTRSWGTRVALPQHGPRRCSGSRSAVFR